MDPETNVADTASLRYLAQDCAQRFGALLRIEDAQDTEANTQGGYWVSRCFADFNMWCARLGVHCEGIRSIDVRLKDIPETCNMLLLLLMSLHRDLDAASRHYAGAPTIAAETFSVPQNLEVNSNTSSLSFESLPSSKHSAKEPGDDAATIQEDPSMIMLRLHISETISRLEGHARLIGQAGASHKRRRVEVYRQRNGPNQIYENFRQLGRVKAKQQFPQAFVFIVERVAESFARRRIRFQYLQEHQKKRAVDMEYRFDRTSSWPLSSLTRTAGGLSRLKELSDAQTASAHRSSDQKTIVSQTVNTEYSMPAQHRRTRRAESVISTASTGQGFPPPPLVIDERIQCPYCLLEFRADEAEKQHWR